MKKTLLTAMTVLVLVWTAQSALAKGKGKGKGNTQTNTELKQKTQDKVRQQAKDNKAETEEVADNAQEKAKGKAKKESEQTLKKAKGKDKGKDTAEGTEKAMGKTHQRQLAAAEEQLVRENQKHLQRQAKLERIVKLADEKGNDKLAEKARQLMQKEQERYNVHTQRMETRKQRIMQAAQADPDLTKVKSRLDVRQKSPTAERPEAKEKSKEKLQQQRRVKTEKENKAQEQEQNQQQKQAEPNES